jgi:hypothetical protein
MVSVSYRDDRQALALQVAALERENDDLKAQLDDAQDRYRKARAATHEERKRGTRDTCGLCGGTLLPVAVFAGHDAGAPLPLHMSTIRFGAPAGGFTHAAPVRAYACTSCGHLEHFIDMDAVDLDPSVIGPPPDHEHE